MNNRLTERYSKCGEIATRNIAGETLIVPVRHRVADLESIYTLNEVASFFWDRIDGNTSVAAMLEAALDTFDVRREQLLGDMSEFLASLQAEGLIELSNP